APTAVSQIVSIDVATGARMEHTSGPEVKVAPQFLSADRVAYLVKSGKHQGLAFSTGERGAEGEMRNPAWSPDGKQVAYQKTSFTPRPQNQPLFSRDPDFELAYSGFFPAFSREGKLAVSASGGAAISIMDADGSHARPVFQE